jgi:hypothetical protein
MGSPSALAGTDAVHQKANGARCYRRQPDERPNDLCCCPAEVTGVDDIVGTLLVGRWSRLW